MKIAFNREWSKGTIRKLLNTNNYLDFTKYHDLKALIIRPHEEDETDYIPDYYEMIFIVPTVWLKDVVQELYEVDDLDFWLKNVYTSTESECIFEMALNESQVVMVDFD